MCVTMNYRAVLPCLLIVTNAFASDAKVADEAMTIFEARCVTCHNDESRKGGLSFQSAKSMASGSANGAVVVAGKPDASRLIAMVSGASGGAAPKMPKKGPALSDAEVDVLRKWIAEGAAFAADRELEDKYEADTDWWSLKPIADPAVPALAGDDAAWARNAIDRFTLTKMRAMGLSPSPEADRRTLIRRLSFDLTGLPPSPDAVDAFVADADPRAYEKLVDRLLASPGYGERWARHWLDIARYGDTHGFDKDKVRPNAWRYRDYVIRALNADKPYDRFVKEQLAGDVFYPGTRDGVVALGFIAAGPWDFVGHVELGENQPDKKIVRNLDRDDMVSATMNTFVSLTAQCARCHNHKFDPITQEDYYALQAVFAAVDRADRPVPVAGGVARRRDALDRRIDENERALARIDAAIRDRVRGRLAALDRQIAAMQSVRTEKNARFGYHSAIVGSPNVRKWVQIDLGETKEVARVVLHPCHDDYAGIGAGFGFPLRYKIEVSDDPGFENDVNVLWERVDEDQPNPKLDPVDAATIHPLRGRYLRITASKLATRQNDFVFALAEVRVFDRAGADLSSGKKVTALDTIEARPRWARGNLVDGVWYEGPAPRDHRAKLAAARAERDKLIAGAATADEKQRRGQLRGALKTLRAEFDALPEPRPELVYAAATAFKQQGNFRATGGKTRAIYRLIRGSEKAPDLEAGPMRPAALSALAELSHQFDLPAGHDESAGRAALANWILDRQNPLTWRSIVNRVWQYHFTRGLVDSPNDFGRMGAAPTHPELLDYLATHFRDGDRSLKDLHRLVCNSATYRQSSAHHEANAAIDGSNRFLWRQNRRKLSAEAIRDSTLTVAGKLSRAMGGPGYKLFGFKDDHSPHYKYHEHDPDDAATHRRSVYRMVVRSVPDPFMETLDCADPSQIVAKRTQTLTALQALALMNNRFMVRMAEHYAARVQGMGTTPAERINAAYRVALGRNATPDELQLLRPIADTRGMANVCRIILNSNEFIFVD